MEGEVKQGRAVFRQIAVGENVDDAVTVGIEAGPDGKLAAAVWWPATGDIDADEAQYADVAEALNAAEAARTLHGFREVVVCLQSPQLWDKAWGDLRPTGTAPEPIGDISQTDLTSSEALNLARDIEAERDA
jgi:hypothetical protein